ncbi:hypothetical protein [Flavobacterium aquatile]|uniref:hypothetical protein n=1 Tax=Flavobacterium aquatile TaxID=245 RepID=UPI00068F6379|nr:hypothetical protein [Flavobacterium aquatile]OXA68695.1 hypothetical protein B0A61_03015 [Flavobacterium aquatile LMG 4008 = ATCC 11947]GEC77143.1 hypothetical protein FAQ01_00130 [Flavobacterium aquatile]
MENQTNLELNAQAEDALRVSAKWSMFLAIMGFIGIALMIIAAIFMSFAMSMIPDDPYAGQGNPYGGANPFLAMKGFISVIYFILAAIYFVPVYYLFKYASGMKEALSMRSSDRVSDALVFLKSHHKFLGIMMIVLISLYILIIIGMVIYFASMAASGGM